MKKIHACILGSGKIACDLLTKIIKSEKLLCKMFAGRNPLSEGVAYANELGMQTSSDGIYSLLDDIDNYDVIFDATSALAHLEHQKILKKFRKTIINLTPINMGIKCVPAVNINAVKLGHTIDMITCGGQAALPLIYSVKESVKEIDYIEIVSSISSKSAGMATRLNINEYLENTENAIYEFSKCDKRKAILNLNPAEPCVDMQTTIYMLIDNYSPNIIDDNIAAMIKKVRAYVPYYELVCKPIFEGRSVNIMIKVKGSGDYLPAYAGNLDIVTSAALCVAEHLYRNYVDGGR